MGFGLGETPVIVDLGGESGCYILRRSMAAI
jgi:hypothetical protein